MFTFHKFKYNDIPEYKSKKYLFIISISLDSSLFVLGLYYDRI